MVIEKNCTPGTRTAFSFALHLQSHHHTANARFSAAALIEFCNAFCAALNRERYAY